MKSKFQQSPIDGIERKSVKSPESLKLPNPTCIYQKFKKFPKTKNLAGKWQTSVKASSFPSHKTINSDLDFKFYSFKI